MLGLSFSVLIVTRTPTRKARLAMVRPSVRPRLVEEGVPIGYSIENERDETMEIEPLGSSSAASAPPPPAPPRTSSTSNNSQSSLLRAAGGYIRPPRRSTKTVIGGESSLQEENSNPRESAYSYQQAPPQPPPAPTHGTPGLPPYSYCIGPTADPPVPASHYHLPPAPCPPPPAVAPPPPSMHYHPAAAAAARPATTTHIEIGAETPPERMEGVEDHSEANPLVVLDGANVAYAYAKAAGRAPAAQPDLRGLHVAWQYWHTASVRVSIVVPQSYLRDGANGPLWRDQPAQYFETLRPFMVAAPSRDDDDAYALQIAKRENQRAVEKSRRLNVPLRGPAYVVSNDMFRDAQRRDATGQLEAWLNSAGMLGPGRISYTFCDLQRMNEYGEQELDFLPNSRHALVEWIEKQRLLL